MFKCGTTAYCLFYYILIGYIIVSVINLEIISPDEERVIIRAQCRDLEGCMKSCTTSEHGCCYDNKTPAHGPAQEGCCLLTPFGCCPDNYRPAGGADSLKACECQNTVYGCCSDNVTISTGSNMKGCACEDTVYGCCPDRHSVASGSNFEGCLCYTFKYGCCPDGITVASGPDSQGCHCTESKFGCCGDRQTHAEGPYQEGCDCSKSEFGCCLDGITESSGPGFLGCIDKPENKQVVCSLKQETGSCHNFSAYWHFDIEYGGCLQFWYSGCEGNENRFNTKELCVDLCVNDKPKGFCRLKPDRGPCNNYTINWGFNMVYGGCTQFWYGGCQGNENRFVTREMCENICVSPPPKDACNLPYVKGSCKDNFIRWYYDNKSKKCVKSLYGGCLGNDNNFKTMELCQAQCEPQLNLDRCHQEIDRGPCAGNYTRWGFNKHMRWCEPFTWGGCEGTANRFQTEASCMQRCRTPGVQQPECSELQVVGNCQDIEAAWSFSQEKNRCVPFYYSGCGGNRNRFEKREDCEEACPSIYNTSRKSEHSTEAPKILIDVRRAAPLTGCSVPSSNPFASFITEHPGSEGSSTSTPTGKEDNCKPSVTRLRGGGHVCAGQTLFEDNFDNLREDVWQVEQHIPINHPEYPFVSYQHLQDNPTVWTSNGVLNIKLIPQQNVKGFNTESIYAGTLNLFSGCTASAEACRFSASGADILPPIVSGRINSQSFAFTYGTVHVRAKLPQGDWIYPEILLEPFLKKYGSQRYASGVIKIAAARGNKELYVGNSDYSNRILYGGPILDFDCRDHLLASKVLYGGRMWGDDYHVYSMRWTPDRIILFVDGEEWARVEPAPNGLSDRLTEECQHAPRMLLSSGTKLAPFDDHFYLTLGITAGGITEFPPGATTTNGRARPWSNSNPKAKLHFWQDISAWKQTWTQAELSVDYVKIIAL